MARLCWILLVLASSILAAQETRPKAAGSSRPASTGSVSYPPVLPDGQASVSLRTEAFLRPPATLADGVSMAATAPSVDFLYYPGQTYPGNPWSNWGQGTFANGRYYSAIGDHRAPQGNAFVYEYDPETKAFRLLCDVRKVLNLPDGHYTPGKIHSHLGLGKDGWLYFTTHRGSTRATTPANHYRGDWLLRADPKTGTAEIVEHGPVPNHCLPTGELDPQRLVFFGSTAPGEGENTAGIRFFAYDLARRKMLYAGPDGPSRAMLVSSTTGRVYYVPGQADGPLMRFDPESGQPPTPLEGKLNVRAATTETPQGLIYAVSFGRRGEGSTLSAFDVMTERIEPLGPAGIGVNEYTAALSVDPSGRYIYYVPGAHGGSEADGSAIVQYDTRLRRRKVIACLHPVVQEQLGCTLKGTYSAVLDSRGERLFVTWNVSRGSKAWDSCGLTVIHIPASERTP